MATECKNHPCFDEEARHRFARVHLPVAPRCNIGCNFCDRKFDCMNESRPGVTSQVLSPQQALSYFGRIVEQSPHPVSVMGIAGPGDPFANPEETMETLRLIREAYLDVLLCVATNGLAVGPYIEEMGSLSVSHVTITINAVNPLIGWKIYRFVRDGRMTLRGIDAAECLLRRQIQAIGALKRQGIMVKINSIVMPGINDHHIEEIARVVAGLGADFHNCMALVPVESTPFGTLDAPSDEQMAEIRLRCLAHLPQMKHCSRCRADAAGLLGEANDALVEEALFEATQGADYEPMRPFVAFASHEGLLVNQHLGQAEQFWVFQREAGGIARLVESREAPGPGDGENRWSKLAELLHDCHAVVCSSAGQSPQQVLRKHGVRVMVAEGLIEEALDAIGAGRRPHLPARVAVPEAECDDDGVGCGGCPGPGTGCG